ncbi:uncharacterized protein F4807DRAFT_158691 [Annulohypoxylon truncatum]|uniref:uncharacterized protein n=1 Tax=Annulohypoxylon truncatum TaxID=327061 RepID=UPI0020088FD3|nr:uncharacterized protein F4807DRAFT_158691 [Annulohypoxylon truncatum]KAI1208289.1 hypothetical protein F4807DRAFT_158691 [Annulohypoxylon truncatum]
MNANPEGTTPQIIIDHVTRELDKYRIRRKQGYSSVHALLLSWEEGDATFGENVRDVALLFQESLNYLVLPYKIPSDDSQRRLNLYVAQFLSQYGGGDNLIVVYYAGHGAPSPSKLSDCQWAALGEGGPMLDWSSIQPQFLGADCDVVMFLDCCYAGQAARARTSHRVELLASTDKDQFTPIGGTKERPSFTNVLIREMKRMLKDFGAITLPMLEKSMATAKSGLVKQPFYVPLSSYDPKDVVTAIRLTRWEHIDNLRTHLDAAELDTERAFFELRFRLTHNTNLDLTTGLVDWVTKNSPTFIDDIEIVKGVLSDARAARNMATQLIQPVDFDGPSPTHISLPSPAQQRVFKLLEELNQAILMPTRKVMGDIEAVKAFHNIRQKANEVSEFIKSCLTSLDEESCEILRRQEFSCMKDLGDQISMRLTLLQNDTRLSQIRVNFENSKPSRERIRIGQIEACRPVLVEYFSYDARKPESYAKASKQVAKVSALLSHPKDPAFRTLPGIGFTHDTIHGPQFGLVYDLSHNRDNPHFCFLSDVIKKIKFMPLDVRCRLSLALCEAVMRLHSIGWFHKGIKSENVLIFSSNPLGQLGESPQDLECPYLIGFDCSRPEDAETWATEDFNTAANIYRHPDRWGNPSRFERHHDLYALGVLLIEIGYWKVLPSMLRGGVGAVKDRETVRESILEIAAPNGRLSHATGAYYASAAYSCLESAGWRRHQGWEYHDIIRSKIWAPLNASCSTRRLE